MAATMTGIASSCRSRPGHGEGRVRSRRSEPTGGPWRELQADAHTCQLAGWGRGLHLPVGGPGPSGSGQRSWRRGPVARGAVARANDHGAGRQLSTISEQRARGAQGPIPPAGLARPMERGGDSSRRSAVVASGGWPAEGAPVRGPAVPGGPPWRLDDAPDHPDVQSCWKDVGQTRDLCHNLVRPHQALGSSLPPNGSLVTARGAARRNGRPHRTYWTSGLLALTLRKSACYSPARLPVPWPFHDP